MKPRKYCRFEMRALALRVPLLAYPAEVSRARIAQSDPARRTTTRPLTRDVPHDALPTYSSARSNGVVVVARLRRSRDRPDHSPEQGHGPLLAPSLLAGRLRWVVGGSTFGSSAGDHTRDRVVFARSDGQVAARVWSGVAELDDEAAEQIDPASLQVQSQ